MMKCLSAFVIAVSVPLVIPALSMFDVQRLTSSEQVSEQRENLRLSPASAAGLGERVQIVAAISARGQALRPVAPPPNEQPQRAQYSAEESFLIIDAKRELSGWVAAGPAELPALGKLTSSAPPLSMRVLPVGDISNDDSHVRMAIYTFADQTETVEAAGGHRRAGDSYTF